MDQEPEHSRIVYVAHGADRAVRRHWLPAEFRQALGSEPRIEWQAHQRAAEYGLAPPIQAVNFDQGWLQMPRIDGVHLPNDWLTRSHHCEQLLRSLLALRSVPCDDIPTLSRMTRCQTLHMRLRQRDAAKARTYDLRLSSLAAADSEVGEGGSDHTVLVHGDLHRKNIFVPAGTDRWLLIDWEYAHRGHELEDLAGVLADHPGSFEALAAERGELAAALRESCWSPSVQGLGHALALRRLLNDLWADLYATLQKDAGKLE